MTRITSSWVILWAASLCIALALSTLPSTSLLFPHYPLCVAVHTWAAWVTVTFMGLSRHRPRPSPGAVPLQTPLALWWYPTVLLPPPKGPNIPAINKSDWLNCGRTEWIVHTSQSATTDCFREVEINWVAWLDRWIAPHASESKHSKIDSLSSPHISLCAVYTRWSPVKDVDCSCCFKSSSVNDVSLKYARVTTAARFNRLMHSKFIWKFIWAWRWCEPRLPPPAPH